MTTGRDDDALTWDGDDDPTLAVSGSADEPPATGATGPTAVLPEGYTAVGRGSETVSAADAEAPSTETADDSRHESGDDTGDERAPIGNGALIALGVLGGVYALFAIGWLIGGLRLQRLLLLTDAMYLGSLWLAVLAPVLWFGTVFLLTRASRAWVRFAWLGAGAGLFIPWPFVMIGAVGQ